MKIRWIVSILLFSLLGLSLGISQEEEKSVRKVLADQVNAWNAGDIDGYMRGYWNSDSTEFVSGGNLTRGYANVLARYKKTYDTRDKMGTLEFSDLSVRVMSTSFVVATGVWRLLRVQDRPWGRFTLIVQKKPGGWRIIHDHTSIAK